MGRLVVGDNPRVTAWVARQLGCPYQFPYQSMGYEINGELVAGVYFQWMTDNMLVPHIASVAKVLPLKLLLAVGAYAFRQLKVERMTFFIEEANTRCVDMVVSLGADLESRMTRGTKSGDVLVFALWDTCAFRHRLEAKGRF